MNNIVLIGMPGCGKTSAGEIAARRLDMDFIDIDAEIVKNEKMEIPEIFDIFGEARFRMLEAEYTRRFSKAENAVISTGGGVVLNSENMKNLKTCGVILFIDRDVDDILNGNLDGRPLISGAGRQKLIELYNERINLYKKYADMVIKAGNGAEGTAFNIISTVREMKK